MVELTIGKKAPDFSVPITSGKTIKLSKLKSEKVALSFCPRDNTLERTTLIILKEIG